MSLKKPYWPPSIEVVSIDVDISVCMTSLDGLPNPGETRPDAPEEVVNASTFKSKDTNESFDENPFRE
jgi:hypothetical protein